MKVAANVVLLFGLILLFHCGISVKQYQNLLLDLDEPYDGVPVDLYMECVVAMIISCAGIVWGSHSFSSIMVSSLYTQKDPDFLKTRSEFMIFNHRGTRMHRQL